MSLRILIAGVVGWVGSLLAGATVFADTPSPLPDPGTGNLPGNGQIYAGAGAAGSTVTVTAGTGGAGGGGGVPASASAVCTSATVDATSAAELAATDPSVNVTLNGPAGSGGTWLLIECPGGSPSLIYTGPGAPAPLAPNPAVLAQAALSSMHLAAMPMRMAPSGATIVAPFTTWLAVDPSNWKPMSATATAGGVSAMAVARPERVIWSISGRQVAVCTGPGSLYNPGEAYDAQHTDCAYQFPRSSAGQPGSRFQVSATVVWSVGWTSTGAGGVGGTLGEVSGDPATAPVEVDEVQVVNQ